MTIRSISSSSSVYIQDNSSKINDNKKLEKIKKLKKREFESIENIPLKTSEKTIKIKEKKADITNDDIENNSEHLDELMFKLTSLSIDLNTNSNKLLHNVSNEWDHDVSFENTQSQFKNNIKNLKKDEKAFIKLYKVIRNLIDSKDSRHVKQLLDAKSSFNMGASRISYIEDRNYYDLYINRANKLEIEQSRRKDLSKSLEKGDIDVSHIKKDKPLLKAVKQRIEAWNEILKYEMHTQYYQDNKLIVDPLSDKEIHKIVKKVLKLNPMFHSNEKKEAKEYVLDWLEKIA